MYDMEPTKIFEAANKYCVTVGVKTVLSKTHGHMVSPFFREPISIGKRARTRKRISETGVRVYSKILDEISA